MNSILKSQDQISLAVDSEGYLVIYDHSAGCEILLSPQQVNSLILFFERKKDEIELAWNDGIKHG